jgi:hypothetical protein
LFNRDWIEHQLAYVERNEVWRADNTAVWDAGPSTIDAVVGRPDRSQDFGRRYDCTAVASEPDRINASKHRRAC